MKSYFHRALLLSLILLICLTVFFLIPEEKSLLQENLRLENDFEEIKKVRVLCWIMTSPTNRIERAVHVQNTWGKRCDKLLLMSSRADNQTDNVIALPVDEGRENLWRKTRAAFEYVYKHHLGDADWFIKADDDTYVVMDNLRYMLYQYSPTFPIYFGYRFSPFVKQGYMAGGCYVLSKEALTRFAIDSNTSSPCNLDTDNAEDVQVGLCMDHVGVITGDGRDESKSERFLPLGLEYVIKEHALDDVPWMSEFMYYKYTEGIDTASDIGIAFHYTDTDKMYLFEYLIYHLRAAGLEAGPYTLPKKLTFEAVLENLLEAEKDRSTGIVENTCL